MSPATVAEISALTSLLALKTTTTTEEQGPLTFAVLVAVATGYSHTTGQLTARSCASAATTVVGATFPCQRRFRSQSYHSVYGGGRGGGSGMQRNIRMQRGRDRRVRARYATLEL